MQEKLKAIREEALKAIEQADMPEKLNDVRVKFLGKKGELTAVLKSMKDVAKEDRPKVGQMVNETREAIEKILEEVERIFVGMGYEVVEGPEVEYDLYNFEKLNIPADHPAKDEQDTFYINKDIVLRTQTSPVQARVMEQGKLPIRMIAPGRRCNTFSFFPSDRRTCY